jgi:hypothetical protein
VDLVDFNALVMSHGVSVFTLGVTFAPAGMIAFHDARSGAADSIAGSRV